MLGIMANHREVDVEYSFLPELSLLSITDGRPTGCSGWRIFAGSKILTENPLHMSENPSRDCLSQFHVILGKRGGRARPFTGAWDKRSNGVYFVRMPGGMRGHEYVSVAAKAAGTRPRW